MIPIAFRQATKYKRGRSAPISLIVIHSAECAETDAAAENLAAYGAAMPADRSASWHYAVDQNSVTQSVLDADTAWHAVGVNDCAIGIEHAGRAKQTEFEWLDEYSAAMLRLSAQLVAGLCLRHDISPVYVDAAGLLRGERGITTHADVTKAHKRGNHWDPGPGFPMAWYLTAVGVELAALRVWTA